MIEPKSRGMELRFLAEMPFADQRGFVAVLDANGKLLQSQGTGELEAGNDYDKPKVLAFLKQHASGAGK